MSSFTKDFTVGAPSTIKLSVKPVDSKTLEGSYSGDHRAAANKSDLTAAAKNPPGPRDAARQSSLDGKAGSGNNASTKNYEGVGG